jgi:hypothetical protein
MVRPVRLAFLPASVLITDTPVACLQDLSLPPSLPSLNLSNSGGVERLQAGSAVSGIPMYAPFCESATTFAL